MLLDSRSIERTHEYVHVRWSHIGDIIGIVQHYYRIHKETGRKFAFYSKTICRACKNRCRCVASNQVKEVVDLIRDPAIIWAPHGDYEVFNKQIIPWWANKPVKYAKAKDLPTEKLNIVTCQLKPRTKRNFSINNDKINEIVDKFSNKFEVFNLSDFNIEGTEWCNGSLREKAELIAQAQFHFGVDSGMAHLGCMTNTPIIVVGPNRVRNRYFLNDVYFFRRVFKAIDFIEEKFMN